MATIATATNAAGAALFRPLPAPGEGPLALHGTMRSGGVDSYWSYWVHRDPWNEAAQGRELFQKAGDICFGHEFLSDDAYRRTDYFDQFAQRYDSGHKLFLKICDGADPVAGVTHLTLSRSFKQDAFGAEGRDLLKSLWPQLRQAVRASALLRRVPHVEHLAEAGLHQLPHPCWILRSDHRIDFANAAAEATMGTGAWLGVSSGRLVRVGDLAEAALQSAMRTATQGSSHHGLVAYQRDSSASLSRAVIRILPIKASPLYAATWPHAVAMLLLELPPTPDDHAWIRQHLAPHYRLTPNECRVLELLVAGRSVPLIADALAVTGVTVRTHLRGLREKTGRRSQADLVRLGLGR